MNEISFFSLFICSFLFHVVPSRAHCSEHVTTVNAVFSLSGTANVIVSEKFNFYINFK